MVHNSTTYSDNTPLEVIKWLETSRERKQRIRIFYGDNGRCWNEENDTIGYIGRSTGTSKIPLLIKSARSYGGGGILDGKIVRIDTKDSRGKIVTVYKQNGTKFDTFVSPGIGTVYNETTDTLYARCKNAESGERLAAFMNGTRWSK